MKRILLLLVPVLALVAFLVVNRSGPVTVPFTKATRETLVSTLSTNGKVEPIEWAAARAEIAAPVERIYAERGQSVVKGQLLVSLDANAAQLDLATAQSRTNQARAELDTLQAGGRASEIAEIDSGVARTRADLANARREVDALERLLTKGAATRAEANAAKSAAERAELELQSYERRRAALVTKPDRSAAEARLNEGQSLAKAAMQRLATSQIRSPISGILYHFELKPGAYVNPGDLVAQVGRLDKLQVTVYVDEPDLGRVEKGMPVFITWDAIPGRQWEGSVERLPLQVVALGTRQVGEVHCTIDNPDQSLIPGTNINAEIRSRVLERALSLPKEALRREGGQTGVFKLEGGKIAWRRVKPGVASVTRVQILEGLEEGDAVALPADETLKNGDTVNAKFP